MDVEENRPFRFLKLNYRLGNQIIQSFCGIGLFQQIRSSLFNLRKFEESENSTFESDKIY